MATGGRVLAVPVDHPLAERHSVSLEDLADNHVADLGPDAPEHWGDSMVPTRTPLGRRIPRGPAAHTFHEILSLVAAGLCVHPPGVLAARYNGHPGIAFVPLHDAADLRLALVWRSTAHSPHHPSAGPDGRRPRAPLAPTVPVPPPRVVTCAYCSSRTTKTSGSGWPPLCGPPGSPSTRRPICPGPTRPCSSPRTTARSSTGCCRRGTPPPTSRSCGAADATCLCCS
ncbi:hypothetical protein DEJ46_04330 [Streptomyces venezuelae]|uniref:LysR substrate-binding domain-containing protein n=1 Tax=Streptomyces venezuelae TaxID=54571 RepID=A0A5P2ANF9_STRVZ|nr:hypothetical protein DEJ46_04330 [Streptomyces venezuelae]